MNENEILAELREAIEERGMPLAELARRSDVSYYRVYRFHVQGYTLKLAEINKLSSVLTGKTFSIVPDPSDNAL